MHELCYYELISNRYIQFSHNMRPSLSNNGSFVFCYLAFMYLLIFAAPSGIMLQTIIGELC